MDVIKHFSFLLIRSIMKSEREDHAIKAIIPIERMHVLHYSLGIIGARTEFFRALNHYRIYLKILCLHICEMGEKTISAADIKNSSIKSLRVCKIKKLMFNHGSSNTLSGCKTHQIKNIGIGINFTISVGLS